MTDDKRQTGYNWSAYFCLAGILVFLVVTPMLYMSEQPTESADLRSRLSTVETRVEHLREQLGEIRDAASGDSESLEQRYYEIVEMLYLSTPQQKKLRAIMRQYELLPQGNYDETWRTLQIRERILEILTEEQSELYQQELLVTKKNF